MTALESPSILDQVKALSHEIRYDLIRHLAQGERCVCDLEELLELPQSKVSYHLGILKDAELVRSEQRGKNTYYTLKQEQLFLLGGGLLTEIFTDRVSLTEQKKSIC
ncbi:metalloregulator ArsR/SmtB family transcription factor [Deinococcus deserti]|uniref:Putative transcriptional regulator, ArsR family n=1 Tax=Deinococcus deserti (strain DSM 17065 / CIP 109153 / LMG 22923 / VCD115) TaxID=546414 RepID=C1D3X8_DEIDV|nr:metalloregulator ArsR/SmtB family transcription factor [Deinococcus deserti]ACO48207.1 putative transcriptional regulator, ArsR family [Deinococcus deserti VCD115]